MQLVRNTYKFFLQTLRHHDNRPRSFASRRSLNNLSMGGCFMCAMLTSCAMSHLLCLSTHLQSLGIAQHFLDLQAGRSTSKECTREKNYS